MANELDNIEDALAYLESPEYLRMVAHQQGESPNKLLRPNYTPNWKHAETPRVVLTPVPDPVPHPVSPRRTPRRLGSVPLLIRSPWWKFRYPLHDRRPFHTRGSLRGDITPSDRDSGRLSSRNDTAARLWRADYTRIDYVVYSYETPLAWHITGSDYNEWVYPIARYSPTTTRHQSKILTALSANHLQYDDNLREIGE